MREAVCWNGHNAVAALPKKSATPTITLASSGRDPGGKNIYVTMGDSGQGLYPWRCGRNAEHGPQFGIVLGLPMSWVDIRCLRATDQRSGHRAAGQGWRDPVVRPFLPLRLGRSYKLVPETDGSPLFTLLPFSRLVIAFNNLG